VQIGWSDILNDQNCIEDALLPNFFYQMTFVLSSISICSLKFKMTHEWICIYFLHHGAHNISSSEFLAECTLTICFAWNIRHVMSMHKLCYLAEAKLLFDCLLIALPKSLTCDLLPSSTRILVMYKPRPLNCWSPMYSMSHLWSMLHVCNLWVLLPFSWYGIICLIMLKLLGLLNILFAYAMQIT